MRLPRVSIILLCYNHEKYVKQSILSVLEHDYENIEFIIVDDCSTDNSAGVIRDAIAGHSGIRFIENKENLGNCKSFNLGFEASSGEFIVDLAADDFMNRGKLSHQVQQFQDLTKDFGVVYSDAKIIDENDQQIGLHSEKIREIGKFKKMPEGDVFKEVIGYFFISAATQLIRREVLEELQGFDENLAYEDYDFWVRSSRNWKYAYSSEILMTLRKLKSGMSAQMYGSDNKMMESTFEVALKAQKLIQSESERKSLINRAAYEMRMCYKYDNKKMLRKWHALYKELGGSNLVYSLLKRMK